MFDTVLSFLNVQFSSHTIETRERLIFQNTSKIPRLVDPGYREHQPRMKFAGLKDKDLEKELSEAIERENEISEALDRCFASAKEDLRLLSLEHERAEKLSRELTIAQQEISSLKTLLAEARGATSDARASQSSEALQAMNTNEPAATNKTAVQSRSDKSEGAAHAPALRQEEPSPTADASVSPSRHSGPDIVDTKNIPEMAKTKSELAMGGAVGQHRRDEPNLDATPPRQNDLHSSAVRFVAAPVESWSNTLSSSCDPGSSACIVEGVVDWITRNEKRGIKSSGTGVFLVPGFAKFVVIKKPATKERRGTNPFTKEPMTFKAKPARKIVRARPVKAAKDAV